jgi:SAM-dependent methyltransferase
MPAPLPSGNLMFRVSGDDRTDVYLLVGMKCFSDIVSIAAMAGRPVSSFRSVLDFGCGCGRVLRLWPIIEGQSVHGTDLDGDAVSWCKSAMPRFKFEQNWELPPTQYAFGQFDLIYSISVFSHLRLDYAEAWVKELKRITAPGGLVLISLHGSHLLADQSDLENGAKYDETDFWKGHFPDWYGNLYLSEDGAHHLFEREFQIIKFMPRGMASHQDVILLAA